MSSTGATLSGSYSGASATPTAVGFKWGTSSGNLTETLPATNSNGSFSASLSGLTANTPYYYKAYVTVSGTGDYASNSETFYGTEYSFTTKAVATATVTTNAASGVSSSQATLNASFSGATGTIYDRGFRYKKGNGSWITPSGLGSTTGTSGNFSMVISSLEPSTTYSFQAYVTEWDEAQNQYVDCWASNTLTFTTAAQQTTPTTGGWLELPEVTGNEDFVGKFYGSGSTAGTNRNYSYSYNYNYYASMWVAYPLTAAHTSGSGGTSSWRYNPNIANNKQINIVSNAYGTMYGASQYARGHQIPNASRKSDDTMNLQTYYSTNQTPQLQNKFNGSIWSSLEGAVRNLTSSVDTVYVVTGPLYRKVGGSETINYLTGASSSANPASLPIPNYYWKALLKVKRDGNGNVTAASTIGFFFEHKEYSDSAYANYVVSVNQIETWTGLNLFHNLPDSIEETAESNTSWSSFQSYSNINSVSGNNWGSF
ncbi:MAG: DNA/RNA non-specific endonuclease [Bacteroidales bacterium]|nr:DNA/RNA non-specific endonuclease [Bacteroidales bacterium]